MLSNIGDCRHRLLLLWRHTYARKSLSNRCSILILFLYIPALIWRLHNPMVFASAQPKWPERPGAALHDLLYNPRPPTSFSTLSRSIPLTRLCLCYYTTTTWTKRVFPSHQPLLFSYKDFLNADCISRKTVSSCREATSQIHGWYKCSFLFRPYLLSSRAGSTKARTIYITARIQLPKLRLMFTLTTSLQRPCSFELAT